MCSTSPSVLSRIDRLDTVLGHLEEMRARTSTNGNMTAASDDDAGFSVESWPKSLSRRRCRPINEVVTEGQVKGNIINRVDHLEIRVLKLEEEMEQEKRDGEERSPRKGKKGLKSLVKSCVKGDLKTKE